MQTVNLPMTLREFSHELRTPLTGIMGMAELLAMETLTDEQKSQVEDIRKSSDQLLKVITRLLMESQVISRESNNIKKRAKNILSVYYR